MVTKLQDLIELPEHMGWVAGIELTSSMVETYTISRSKGSIGIDFSFTVPFILEIEEGSDIEFKGIGGMVTSVEHSGKGSGWQTTVAGVSAVGKLIHKSPARTLMYMSMSQVEIDEFDLACKGDYSNLDYIPMIKKCSEQTQLDGWKAHDIIRDLFEKAGVFDEIVINVYNFWVKQIEASNTSSYFDSAMSVVNFLKPLVYEEEVDGAKILYILDRPSRNGSVDFQSPEDITQRRTFNFESRTQYFQFLGGYGKWIREKSKITAVPEKEATMISETYQEKPMLCTVTLKGDVETTNNVTGEKTIAPGTYTYSFWLKEPMREKYTTTEIWRIDPFGNFKAMLSRHVVGYNMTLDAVVLDQLEESVYEFLTEEFERPRLSYKQSTLGKYSWTVASGVVSWRGYKGKVEEISESWAYTGNGTLIQETYTKSMDCVKLWDGDEWIALDMADKFYRTEGSEDTCDIERMTVEERVTKYRQTSPDYYERASTIRKLGPLARKVGQENYQAITEMVRGKVPRHPRRYRMLQVYADNLPDEPGTTNVPVMQLSNPNVVDWADAEAILQRMMILAHEANVVERSMTLPKALNLDVGWQVGFPIVPLGHPNAGAQIPSFVPPNWSMINAWSITKSAGSPGTGPEERTTVTVEGR